MAIEGWISPMRVKMFTVDTDYDVREDDYFVSVNSTRCGVEIILPETLEEGATRGRQLVIKDEAGHADHSPIVLRTKNRVGTIDGQSEYQLPTSYSNITLICNNNTNSNSI